jgi:hypothetical protein
MEFFGFGFGCFGLETVSVRESWGFFFLRYYPFMHTKFLCRGQNILVLQLEDGKLLLFIKKVSLLLL